MAHMAHYTAAQVAVMLSHYGREEDDGVTRSNENIRPDATASNYVVFPDERYSPDTHHWASDVRRFVRKCIDETNEARAEAGKRKLRSNATVMSDVVFTLPRDWPAERDSYDFFSLCHQFIAERYGGECSLPGFVHMDETTPHMHCPIVPRVDGQISKRDVISRADLKSFHGDLQAFMDKQLGFHVSVLLDEEQKVEKAKSRLSQDELKTLNADIKAEVEAEVAERQRELDSKALEVERGREDNAKEANRLNRLSEALRERDEQQDERDAVLDRRARAVLKGEADNRKRADALDKREANLARREGLLATLKKQVLALIAKLKSEIDKRLLEEMKQQAEEIEKATATVTVDMSDFEDEQSEGEIGL